jgi:hypothetical protein
MSRRTIRLRIREAGIAAGYEAKELDRALSGTDASHLSVRVDGAQSAHWDAGQCPFGEAHAQSIEAVTSCAEGYVASELVECGA